MKGRHLVSVVHDIEIWLLNDGSSCPELAFVSRSLVRGAKWFPDIKTHGSDHIPTYVEIRGLCPSKIRDNRVDRTRLQSLMEDRCQSTITCRLENTLKSTVKDTTCTFACSSKLTHFDTEL